MESGAGKGRADARKNELEGTDRAGECGCRAGITIQAGNTEGFKSALIDLPGEDKPEGGIGQEGSNGLDEASEEIHGYPSPMQLRQIFVAFSRMARVSPVLMPIRKRRIKAMRPR